MDFVALDVETVNADLSSICQIGVVDFQNGKVARCWQTLVNPEDYFDPFNVEIHGIDEDQVQSAPLFPDIYLQLKEMLEERVVVSHMPFDRLAIARVSEKHELEIVQCKWLDSARVARRAWMFLSIENEPTLITKMNPVGELRRLIL
jgi:DNA polymerase-3 subunit epsilon